MPVGEFLDIVFPGQPAFLKEGWKQGVPVRHVMMMMTVQKLAMEFGGRPLNILEVGSWMGSSCLTWCEALRIHNQGLGKVTCVDPLIPYFDPDELGKSIDHPLAHVAEGQRALLIEMDRLLRGDYVYDILMHNVRSVPPPTEVEVVRQKSADYLPTLPDESFDLVYIDGSHFYDPAIADIIQGMRLVCDSGIVCGDDMDLALEQVDQNFAWDNRNVDFPTDPRTGIQFHPGVTLAVDHALGEVTNYFGYWLTQRKKSDFFPLDLTAATTTHIPSHFGAGERQSAIDELKLLFGN
jgi:predicted O-methyltransferase YrrM